MIEAAEWSSVAKLRLHWKGWKPQTELILHLKLLHCKFHLQNQFVSINCDETIIICLIKGPENCSSFLEHHYNGLQSIVLHIHLPPYSCLQSFKLHISFWVFFLCQKLDLHFINMILQDLIHQNSFLCNHFVHSHRAKWESTLPIQHF